MKGALYGLISKILLVKKKSGCKIVFFADSKSYVLKKNINYTERYWNDIQETSGGCLRRKDWVSGRQGLEELLSLYILLCLRILYLMQVVYTHITYLKKVT